jgi:ribosomal protein S3AE
MKPPKKNKKDSQLVLRVNKEERDLFVELCEDMDTSASREIRRFMKEFIKKHASES